MKTMFIVGNWKSNHTVEEAKIWLGEYRSQMTEVGEQKNISVVLCVPLTVLATCQEYIKKYALPIEVGAQDVSPFGKGAFTGEVTGEMIKELASYVLVGHSERRKYFKENFEELAFQSLQAKSAGLTVIYCVSETHMDISNASDIVAYEPISAIGSGQPEDPKSVERVCKEIAEKTKKPVLYGGSVTKDTVQSFLKQEHISGVLVGKASLDASDFMAIIKNAMR